MMDSFFAKIGLLNGTALKWIALISMTIDHIGMIFFPTVSWIRILGRLAFPVFAYMLAEGCFYTRNKRKYLTLLFGIGTLMQAVMLSFAGSWNLNIMFTLGAAAVLIFLLQWALGRRTVFSSGRGGDGEQKSTKPKAVRWMAFVIAVFLCVFVAVGLKKLCPGFKMDYGIFGILLPFVIYLPPKRYQKLIAAGIWMCFLSMSSSRLQWFCLFALIPLALYNGKPGKKRIRYFFYLYYPIHLGVFMAIRLLMNSI